MNKKIFLVFLLFSAFSLVSTSFLTIRQHFDTQSYFNALLEMEYKLQQQLNQLETLANAVNNNVSILADYSVTQKQILETGLIEERDLIYQVSSELVIPWEKQESSCKQLTKSETEALDKQIGQAQRSLETLKDKVSKQKDCQRNVEIKSQIDYLNLYFGQLAKQVNCEQSDSKIVLVPNSKNQYFIYGKNGQQKYQQSLSNLLNQGYIKTECPSSNPFPKQSRCVSCPKDKIHYYDLTKFMCISCPDGYSFNAKKHTCLKKTINSNPMVDNYYGNFPNFSTDQQTCPQDTPFFNGQSCISCKAPKFFDFGNLQCKLCPSQTSFDPSIHLCTYKKYNSNINTYSTNYCCGIIPNDPTADSCPTSTPFFNGQQCVSCQLPAFFSFATMSCSLCSDGLGFSLVQRQCVENKYLGNVFISGNSQKNYIGNPPQYGENFEKVTRCPNERPFFTGSICIPCPLPNYFNFGNNKCEACPEEFRFDLNERKCKRFSSFKFNSNFESLTNFIEKIPNYNPSLATCSIQKPLFNGEECVACPLPYFADLNSLQCKQCEPGYGFSAFSFQCVTQTPKFYTNMRSNNIYFNGNFQSVISDITQKRSRFNAIQECEISTPFFDQQTNKCINCPKQYPLFDFKFNRCIDCTDGGNFSQQNHICLH